MANKTKTPDGVTVYLDDIVFTQERLPTPTPAPTIIPATPTAVPDLAPHAIYAGNTLTAGYDMNVDSAGHLTGWVNNMGDHMCMNYPGGQSWAAVFITNGQARPASFRTGQDLSQYRYLHVELKGDGSQSVRIGLKDSSDPDDGTETRYTITPPPDWQSYNFSLADFYTADPTNLYVMIEFVFGSDPATICFRNVMYLP